MPWQSFADVQGFGRKTGIFSSPSSPCHCADFFISWCICVGALCHPANQCVFPLGGYVNLAFVSAQLNGLIELQNTGSNQAMFKGTAQDWKIAAVQSLTCNCVGEIKYDLGTGCNRIEMGKLANTTMR